MIAEQNNRVNVHEKIRSDENKRVAVFQTYQSDRGKRRRIQTKKNSMRRRQEEK